MPRGRFAVFSSTCVNKTSARLCVLCAFAFRNSLSPNRDSVVNHEESLFFNEDSDEIAEGRKIQSGDSVESNVDSVESAEGPDFFGRDSLVRDEDSLFTYRGRVENFGEQHFSGREPKIHSKERHFLSRERKISPRNPFVIVVVLICAA